MVKFYKSFVVLFLASYVIHADLFAQLIVNSNLTPSQLAQQVSGPGVQILNPVINCNGSSYGSYTSSNTNLGSSNGIILSTGLAADAIGPNNTGQKSGVVNTPGSPLLNQVTGKTTYDACTFEFDVIPQGNRLKFNFIFASEEYNEWVNSDYNDAFGFFISGPNITGQQNIALVPNTTTDVSINSVNGNANPQYFLNNSLSSNGTTIQFDGFTQGLYADVQVTPCQTYHLIFVIADATDRLWDSGVFIERIESNAVSLSATTAGNIPYMVEGCNPGTVTFTRSNVTNQPLTVTYAIGGTAINGTDYPQVGNSTVPMSPQTIVIGSNQASASITFQPIADNISEGTEKVKVYIINIACNTVTDSISLDIKDNLSVSLTPPASSLCIGQTVQLNGSAPGQFGWSPAAGLSSTSVLNPVAGPQQTTTYTLTATAGACVATATATVNVSNMQLNFNTTNVSCNGGNNGAVNLTVSGGVGANTYSWTGPNGFTASTEDISSRPAGTYSVTVTDAAGCVKTGTVAITQPAAMTITANTIDPNNCNAHNGKITLYVSGGTGPYTYLWPDGNTGSSNYNLQTGTFTIVVTDANGCSQSITVTLTAPPTNQSVTGTISSTNVTCYGANNGTATATVTSNPATNVSYSWSNGGTTSTITGLSPGFYTVVLSRPNGCGITLSTYVSEPPPITFTKTQVNVSCTGGNTGSATVTVSGGTPGYTYSWSTNPVQTTATASNLAAGSYTVTVTDANGCVANTTFTITQPNTLAASVSAQTNVLCTGNSTGSATVSVSGGSPSYSYLWNTNPAAVTATATGLAAGSYTCSITDARGCQANVPVTITQPAQALGATATPSNIMCNGGTGSAVVTVTGGTPAYTYAWSTTPIQTTATANGLPAGTFSCTVTDANSCTFTVPVTITQPATLTASVTSSVNVLCKGSSTGSATAAGTGGTPGYTYSWSTIPVQTTSTATNLAAGTYTVTITDTHSCTATATVIITEPAAALSATISSQTNNPCFGGTSGNATVTASGGTGSYTYTWNTTPVQTTAMATGLAAGTYTVTVKDANNCQVTRTVTITAPAQPLAASIASQTNELCSGSTNGSATAAGSGGSGLYSYVWNTTPAQYSATATNLATGTYQVTISDNNQCPVTATASVTITQPAAISTSFVLSVYGSYNISCNGRNDGSINLTVSGGTPAYTCSWAGPNGFTASTEDIASITAGTYTVTITDANGCVKTSTVALTEPIGFNLTSSVVPASCPTVNNGQITYTFTGPAGFYTFTHTGPNTNNTYTYNCTNVAGCTVSNTFSGLAPGAYTLVGTMSTGCTQSLQTVVTQPGTLTYSYTPYTYASGYNISCRGASNGQINITVGGGTPPYTYVWSGPNSFTSSQEDLTGLAAGTYTVTIYSSAGCNITRTVVLTEPPQLNASLTSSVYAGGVNVGCYGGSNGSITSSVSGGVPGYTYSWTGPNGFTASTANISNLAAGTYSLVVTDAAGCTKSTSTILTQPSQLTVSLSKTDIQCQGGSDGTASSIVTGGIAPYTYNWAGPNGYTSAAANISGVPAGTYTLTIAGANSCTATATITLTEPNMLTATASAAVAGGGFNIACNGAATGNITTIAAGGTAPYQYSWSGPSGYTSAGSSISNLYAGIYSLTVTDNNGCTATATLTLTQPTALSASLTGTTVNGYSIACNGGATGSITSSVSGGNPSYTYSWNGPNGFTSSAASVSSLQAGSYTVSVTDMNGCVAASSITLTQPAALTASTSTSSFSGGYQLSCSGSNDGSVTTTVSGGASPYAFSWTGPSGFTSSSQNISSLAAGTYTCTVNDANNCSVTLSVTLTEPAPLSLSSVLAQYNGYNVSCYGGSNGNIDLSVTGGTAPYSYNWSNTVTMQDLVGVDAGSYSVVVTDANNCSANISAVLTEPNALAGSAATSVFPAGTGVSCFGSTDGNITLATIGGTQPYTYSWSGPNGFTGSSQNISGVSAGNYNVVITDANGCTASVASLLTQPPLLSTALSSATFNNYNVSCNGENDGAITVFVTGGSPVYTYSWAGPGSFASAQSDIDSLYAGNYSLTVNDTNGCIATASITLTQPAPVTSSLTASLFGPYNISCNGSNNGSINVTVSGGISPYSYFWLGPNSFNDTIANVTGLAAGSYHVDIIDGNNCIVGQNITLTEPALLSDTIVAASYVGGNVSCYGATDGSIAITVSGGATPFTYSWTGPNGFTSGSANLSGLAAGSYIVAVTDANQCVKMDTMVLVSPAQLTVSLNAASINGYNIACTGNSTGTINVAAAGGTGSYTYSWTGPNGFTSPASNLAGLVAGAYSLTVSDSGQCTAAASITLNEPAQPLNASYTTSSFAGGYNISCFGGNNGSIDLTVTGGTMPYVIVWRGPNGFASSTEDLSGLVAGSYDVTVSDTNGCMVELTVILTEPPQLQFANTVSMYNGNNISCNNAQDGYINTTLTGGTPGYTYSWSGPNGFTSSAANLASIGAGSYIVSVSDQNGCGITSTITLTEPPAVNASLSTSSFNGGYQLSCSGSNDGTINTTVNGGTAPYVFSWTGPSGFISPGQNISSLAAGTYSCSISDTNGCAVTLNATLTEPVQLTVQGTAQSPACYGSASGSIDIQTAGGAMPYSYSWSNGASSEDISNLGSGTYNVNITDANGCAVSAGYQLVAPDSIALTVSSISPFCSGQPGSIDLGVTGGTAPYTYSWSNGATTQDASFLSPGSFTVTVTDAHNCTSVISATINAGAALDVQSVVTDVKCFADATGAIDITVSQGAAPYTYSWSNGSTAEDLTGLAAGTYTLVLTDNNGCTSTGIYNVTQSPQLLVNISSPVFTGNHNLSGYQSNDGSVDLTVTGGAIPYNYEWSNGSTTMDLDNLAEGIYGCTVTDGNGCKATVSITLTQPLPLEMPTGFSPNDDGKNDYFVVHGIEAFPNNKIVIVNRWGNEVYSRSGYHNEWHGQNNAGEQLPEGTYFVILTIDDPAMTLKGYVDMRR